MPAYQSAVPYSRTVVVPGDRRELGWIPIAGANHERFVAGRAKLRSMAFRDHRGQVGRLLVSVVFLGTMFWLLKGREQDFSIWGGLAAACAFIGIGLLVDLLLRRRQ